MAADMSLVLDPDIAFMADPWACASSSPTSTKPSPTWAVSSSPFGWAKLLFRTKVKRHKSARLILLGVREEIRRNVKRYGFLSAAMYVEVAKRGLAKGYEWAELSWTREDDAPINLGIRSMGGTVYKNYRVYEKKIA